MVSENGLSSSEPATVQDASDSEVSVLHDVARFLRTVRLHHRLMTACLIAGCLLGAAHYATATRIYESNAEIQVLEAGSHAVDGASQASRQLKEMPSYVNVIQSDAVISRVVQDLSPVHLQHLGQRREDWNSRLGAQLTVRNPIDTNVMELRYRSADPEMAAAVLRSIVAAYIAFIDETHQGTSREVLDTLTREKASLEQTIDAKNAELIQLRENLEEFDNGEDGNRVNILVQRVIGLNRSLAAVGQETINARASLMAMETAVRNGEDVLQYAMRSVDEIGKQLMRHEFGLDNDDEYAMARINDQLLNDRSLLFAARNKGYGDNHPLIQRLSRSIQLKEQWLMDQPRLKRQRVGQVRNRQLAPRLLAMARQRLEEAIGRENSVRREFEREKQAALQLNGQMAKLRILDADIVRLNSFYDVLLTRMKDVDLNKDKGVNIAILGEPEVSTSPVSPRLSIVVLAALVGGLGTGLFAVYIMYVLDDRFRSLDEMQAILKVPVLSTIREMAIPEGEAVNSLVTVARPSSVEAESYRGLRTALVHHTQDTRRVVVTSSQPGDGKTTTIGNLAVVFGQAGRRTILIDADMRRPGLTTTLGLRSENGLSTLLSSERPVGEVAEESRIAGVTPNLDVITSGHRPVNPAELLSTERFMELLAWAETNYEQVLVDAPPVLAVTDASIIGRLVDAVMLVVRPEFNSRRMVIQAAEAVTTLGCHLIGAIANQVSSNRDGGYGYGYGYGEGYGESFDDEPHSENQLESYDVAGEPETAGQLLARYEDESRVA